MNVSNGGSNRVVATVIKVEPFWCLALDDMGQVYLLPAKNFERLSSYDFAYVRYGSRVSFIPIEGPKGPRGIEARVDQV